MTDQAALVAKTEAAPDSPILEFNDREGRLIFRITADRTFVMGPTYSEQGAARRFIEWVNDLLAAHGKEPL